AISATVTSGLAALTLDTQIDHIRITIYYNSVLPITFKDFWAEPEQNKIKLNWVTASESNSSYFVVEKMIAANNNWISLDSLAAALFSASERSYVSFDNNPGDNNIYRIKEVDLDGRMMYSRAIDVRYRQQGDISLNIYPNPVANYLFVNSTKQINSLLLID